MCIIKAKISQVYCVLRTNSKPWAPGTHGITTKYWSKRTKRPGIRMSDFVKAILSTGRHRLLTFLMQGCFSWKISLFFTPSLSLPLKPTKITGVLFFMKFSPMLYFCLHLKYTILCWYLGQPHWEGESHYCLSLFLKWMNLYSQLYRFGFKGWYFHDKLLPPTCQSTMSLSSQPAQRQGDDIPQDIWEPRVLPHHHHCCCCLWIEIEQEEYLSFTGFTQRDTLCTIRSALQAEKQANTTNWESCKIYRTPKKSFPSSASALGEA